MDKEAVAIELLRKVGNHGVTPGTIAEVIAAFDAVIAAGAGPKKGAAKE